MEAGQIRPGLRVSGPLLPEPVEVLSVIPMGASLKVIGRGTKTGLTHDPIFSVEQLARLTQIDYEREMAFVAIDASGSQQEIRMSLFDLLHDCRFIRTRKEAIPNPDDLDSRIQQLSLGLRLLRYPRR